MRIGIDISQVVYQGSGVSRFNEGLIKEICKSNTKNEYVFFFSSLRSTLPDEIFNVINNKGFKLISYNIPPKLLSYISHSWRKISSALLPFYKDAKKYTDFFVTSDWSELFLSVPKATIVHDLVFKRFPETLPAVIKKTQEQRLKYISAESDLIFVDSYSTKEDLKKFYNVNDSRIFVNYPGVTFENDTLQKADPLKEKLNIQGAYILSVGKIEPRKNIERLIKAFSLLNKQDLSLVIVGAKGWGNEKFSNIKNVIFTGYVSDTDLKKLYKDALFFIYPSLYEGFGYPVIEAMMLGCPVATSNTSSLGEISKDYALQFDPHNIGAISKIMNTLYTDSAIRAQLSKKGLSYSKKFTFQNYLKTFENKIEEVYKIR